MYGLMKVCFGMDVGGSSVKNNYFEISKLFGACCMYEFFFGNTVSIFIVLKLNSVVEEL